MYYGELKNTEWGRQILKNFSRFYTARKKLVMVFSFVFQCKLQYLCFAASPVTLPQDSTFLSLQLWNFNS